jgi:asparagine synthase (glutamine-hydrolysing)
MSLDFKIKKFFEGYDAPLSRRNTYWLSAFTDAQLESVLVSPERDVSMHAHTDALYTHATSLHDAFHLDYLTGYLPHEVLVKTDRASMRHGLEVRAPFLSPHVVSFARALPHREKLRGRTGKYILKKMMEAYLPKHIVYRKKHGFAVPIGSWIRGKHRTLFTETLLHGPLVSSRLFKQKGIAILLDEHIEGTADHRKKLWTLFVLALWMKEWQ